MRQRFDVFSGAVCCRLRQNTCDLADRQSGTRFAEPMLKSMLGSMSPSSASTPARRRPRQLLTAAWLAAAICAALLATACPARAQAVEEWLDISGGLGSGFMRGGRGGLASAQRSPVFVDATALGVEESWLLVGGSLRVELEDGRAIAAVPRAVLRHKMGKLELRPGAALPFYFAPKTMLGPEADLGVRYSMNNGFGILANAGISAFMIGNDVPHGTTVVMFNLQLGVDLFL